MRSDIRHSGSVNEDQQFTLRLIEMRHATLTVEGGISNVRLEVSESELRDLIQRARYALEDCRLRGLYEAGTLTQGAYEDALRALDKGPPPNEDEDKS